MSCKFCYGCGRFCQCACHKPEVHLREDIIKAFDRVFDLIAAGRSIPYSYLAALMLPTNEYVKFTQEFLPSKDYFPDKATEAYRNLE